MVGLKPLKFDILVRIQVPEPVIQKRAEMPVFVI